MKINKLLHIAGGLLLLSASASAQVPTTAWSKVYGGDRDERAYSIHPTADGGYIVGGYTKSTEAGGDIHERIGNKDNDCWVLKLDANGNIEWEKVYGGSQEDQAIKVIPSTHGGYIMVASAQSEDGDITDSKGHYDMWVVKLNDTGRIEWEHSFGKTDQDEAVDIIETSDGNYLALGKVNTYVAPGYGYGYDDWLVVKLDKDGNTLWEKPLGSSASDYPGSIIESLEGGYLIAGTANAGDSLATGGSFQGNGDWWLVKLDVNGNVEWNRLLGGSRSEMAPRVVQTPDSGYVVAGLTTSNDGDVVRNVPPVDLYDANVWVVKLDKTGQNIIWNKCYGGTSTETDVYLSLTPNDHGFLISGATSSDDHGMPGYYKNIIDFLDGFMLKLDEQGESEWIQHYGGTSQDIFFASYALEDGSYVACGGAGSDDYDIPTHAFTGSGDKLWVLKLDAPEMDSVVVRTKANVAASISTKNGTLDMTATIYPRVLPQNVTWSIVPGTGAASINANGVVTAEEDGTVWAKAVAVNNPAMADSVEITITGQEVIGGSVAGLRGSDLRVNVYPNPTGNTLYLQLDGHHPQLNLSIVNVDGKMVYRDLIPANGLNGSVQLNIANLTSGIYLVQLEGNDIRFSRTIAKQ